MLSIIKCGKFCKNQIIKCLDCNKDVEIGISYYIWTLHIEDKEFEEFMNGRVIMRYLCEECGNHNNGVPNGLTL